jgi:hypothetical protein
MKREHLGYLLAGLSFFVMMSMTITEGKYDPRIGIKDGVHLNVPAKPSSTVYVLGPENMNKLVKKGYQVQQVLDGGSMRSENNYFLMVKY